jgi:tetratricopeptide (TPR) repeat protein
MAELLQKYGIGHTQVLNVNDVYFDKELLLTAEPDGPQDAEEMAYLISGSIAKGFHDHRFVTDWNFHTLQDGSIDFMDDNPAYGPLKNALRAEKGLGERFQTLVERAYTNDAKSGARDKFLKDELERKQHNREMRQKLAAKKEDSSDKSTNGNIYMKLGLTDLAEKEYQRSAKLDKDNPSAKSGMAMVMSTRGNNTEALKLVNEAIAMNPNLGSSYVARAEIYRNMGDTDSALNDCNLALSASESSPYAYKVAGDIFHAQGAADSALMEYKAYHKAVPDANDIPDEYKSQLN